MARGKIVVTFPFPMTPAKLSHVHEKLERRLRVKLTPNVSNTEWGEGKTWFEGEIDV